MALAEAWLNLYTTPQAPAKPFLGTASVPRQGPDLAAPCPCEAPSAQKRTDGKKHLKAAQL